ncbi:DUF3429 family protein [Novosphingobium umbonatum]|uniref:DUF3429 family protein n=2 Tax=Novosphingobium umbonatum TaxID=1908524 RepID=A0A3S2UXU0_9SPHN|nr:DUF3429 family protein [Novosphingobium umbonatum]
MLHQIPQPHALPRPLVLLGLSGVLPQLGCLLACHIWPEARWFALAAGCFYAAIILSFLGGLWWMASMLAGWRHGGLYALAVLPSLIGWGALLPWCFGWVWPAPSLLVLALVLLASPMVDQRLEQALAGRIALPAGWLRLRVMMASGLALLTLALAFLAFTTL